LTFPLHDIDTTACKWNYLASLITISGTAGDNYNLATMNPVEKVEFEIQVDTGTFYRAGTNSFDSAVSSFNVAITTKNWQLWTYENVPWTSGRKYTIRTRALDKAGNLQTSYAVGVNSVTFTYDTTPPLSSIIEPSGPRESSAQQIFGTASDLPATGNSS